MKIYQNPLKLLGNDINTQELDRSFVRRKRKEFLLRFDLTSKTTIKINDSEYDKNTLIEIFNDLESDIEFAVYLSQFPHFLNFLESGNTDFFRTPNEFHVFNNERYKNKTKPYFCNQLNQTLYKLCSGRDFRNIHNIRDIFRQKTLIPLDWKGDCFLKTYGWLEEKKKKLERLVFKNNLMHQKWGTWHLHKDFHDVVKYEFHEKLKILPNEFDGLKVELVDTFGEIFTIIFKDENNLFKFDRDTLFEVKKMCEFAYEQTNEGSYWANVRIIERVLGSREPDILEARFPDIAPLFVLFLAIILIFKYCSL